MAACLPERPTTRDGVTRRFRFMRPWFSTAGRSWTPRSAVHWCFHGVGMTGGFGTSSTLSKRLPGSICPATKTTNIRTAATYLGFTIFGGGGHLQRCDDDAGRTSKAHASLDYPTTKRCINLANQLTKAVENLNVPEFLPKNRPLSVSLVLGLVLPVGRKLANRRKSLFHFEYRRRGSNPHALAGTGF